MSDNIRDSKFLFEIIHRRPIYDDRADAKLRLRCWLDVVATFAPAGYSEIQKKDLEIILRRKWSAMRGLFSSYFKKFYQLVNEIANTCDDTYGVTALIYRYMCLKISDLVKIFVLTEPELDCFLNYFDSRINTYRIIFNLQPTTTCGQSETVARNSVATQTTMSCGQRVPEGSHVFWNSVLDEDFFITLRNELLKLPSDIKLRMRIEILNLVRRGRIQFIEKQQSTLSLIKDLLNQTVSFQTNLLNVQFGQLSQIQQDDQQEPQPGPSSFVPPSCPPKVLSLTGAPILAVNRILPTTPSTSSDQSMQIKLPTNEDEIDTQSDINSSKLECHSDVEMREEPNVVPGVDQDNNQIGNDSPISAQVRNQLDISPNSSTTFEQPSTSRNNVPTYRNESEIEIHNLCEEFVITMANAVLFTEFPLLTSLINVSLNEEPSVTIEAPSAVPISDLTRSRKRNASETLNLWAQNSNEAVDSDDGEIENPDPIEPNPRDILPEEVYGARAMYLRSNNSNSSDGNQTL